MNNTILAVLGHSLWIGLALYFCLLILFRVIAKERPNLRYCTALASLFVFIIGTGAVFPISTALKAREQVTEKVVSRPVPGEEQEVETDRGTKKRLKPVQMTEAGQVEVSTARKVNWTRFLLFGWIAGMTVMLLRLINSLRMISKVRAQSIPLIDSAVEQLVTVLSKLILLKRKVGVASTELLKSPAVVGVLKPLILIPVTTLTSLSEEQSRVVIAHELAHIKRFDYLINMFQNLVELVFFFNPFVWLINHRIRLEREVCCDQAAAALCNERKVAETLLATAEMNLKPVMAFSHKTKDELKERVERLMRTECRKGGERAVFMTLFIAAVMFCGTWFAGSAIGEVGGKLLTPEEVRLKKMDESMSSFYNYDYTKTRIVKGRIVANSNEAVLKGFPIKVYFVYNQSPEKEVRKMVDVDPDSMTFSITYKGRPKSLDTYGLNGRFYAKTYRFNKKSDTERVQIEVLKVKPTVVTLKSKDGERLDVDGKLRVTVRANRTHDVTIINGVANIERPLSILEYKVIVKGYAAKVIQPEVGSKLTVHLEKAVAAEGLITDEYGKPVSGAKVRIRHQYALREKQLWDDSYPELTTDENGVFNFEYLNNGQSVFAVVSAEGYSSEQFEIKTGKDNSVSLKKEIMLNGTIKGAVKAADIKVKQTYFNENSPSCNFPLAASSQYLKLTKINDQLSFSIKPVWRRVKVAITIDGYDFNYKSTLSTQPDSLTIDLTKSRKVYTREHYPKRKVRIHFVPPTTDLAITGQVNFRMSGENYSAGLLRPVTGKTYPYQNEIKNGMVEVTLPADAYLSIVKRELKGYELDSSKKIKIEQGTGIQDVYVALKSSGVICGTLNYSGPMLQFQGISTNQREQERFLKSGIKVINNKFSFPFESNKAQIFAVKIDNKLVVATEPVKCTPESPSQHIKMTVPESKDIVIKVKDEFGQKIDISKGLSGYFEAKEKRFAALHHGFTFDYTNGHAVIKNAGSTVPGLIRFSTSPVDEQFSNWRFLQNRFDINTEEVELEVSYRKIIKGKVVDHSTKEPLKNLTIQAKEKSDRFEKVFLSHPRKGYTPVKKNDIISAFTDSKGQFVITQLEPDGYYNFNKAVDENGNTYQLLVAAQSKEDKTEEYLLYAEKVKSH